LKELKYLNKYLYKYRLNLISGFIIIIFARILLLYTPGLIRNSINVIENFISNPESSINDLQNELVMNVFLILAAAVSAGIFTFLTRQTIINVSRYIEFDLKNEIFNQYQHLSISFYKKNKTGDLINRISEDVSRVRMYFGPAIMYSLNTVVLIIITLIYMYRQSPELTFFTVTPLPILSITIYKLSSVINLRSKKVQESLSKLSSFTQEIFTGIQLVKSYAVESKISKEFNRISNESKQKQVSLVKMQALFLPLMILLIGFSNLLVIYVGGKQYLEGEISNIGIIAEFIIYVNMLTWPVASIGWITSIVQQAAASQKRINEFLKQKSEIINIENGNFHLRGNINFRDVDFIYPKSKINSLKNINFNLHSGKSLGLIGKTGSGKSTLIKLLTRTFNATNGEIMFDNINSKDFNLQFLRNQIGVVPQDSFLFSDTILNNIRFGNESAKLSEIEKVCKIAEIHEEIINFENNYNTLLGERGLNLSGGQKQRLCIARALIKKPKILVLDDCLSALDNKTEIKIVKNLKEFLQKTTLIISSHKISSVKNLNQIIVLNEGKIIQSGKHQKLVNENGYYKNIFLKQSSEK
jgi:ATP-binding cassette subfamily B protein